MKSEKAIIFPHIPKTGGQTVRSVLNREYDRDEPSTFKDHVQVLSADMLKDVDESITLLQGHLVFGVHEWIHREFTCITLLREPARAISIYRYVLTNRQQFSQQEALTIFSKNRLLSGIHDC